MAVAAGEPIPMGSVQRTPNAAPSTSSPDRPSLHCCERSSPVKNRKPEICTSGSVRGRGGNIPTYSAAMVTWGTPWLLPGHHDPSTQGYPIASLPWPRTPPRRSRRSKRGKAGADSQSATGGQGRTGRRLESVPAPQKLGRSCSTEGHLVWPTLLRRRRRRSSRLTPPKAHCFQNVGGTILGDLAQFERPPKINHTGTSVRALH